MVFLREIQEVLKERNTEEKKQEEAHSSQKDNRFFCEKYIIYKVQKVYSFWTFLF